MPKHIEIYIDRIVLEGFEHLNTADLDAAIQEHLSIMIAEQGLSSLYEHSGYHRKLDGGELKLPKQPEARSLGQSIAGSIHQGINNAS